MPKLSRRKVFLTLACLFVAPLLAEGLVRARNYWRHGTPGRLEKYTIDDESGLYLPIPNRVVGGVRLDSRGFRSPELEMPKPDGRVRLVFIGASTTFCAEATDNESTWPHLVCEALREAYPDLEFDYANAAVRGYRIEHSLKNLEHRVRQVQPDIIVVYHAGADLTVDTRDLAVAAGLAEPKKEESWLMRNSMTWFLLEKNLRYMRRSSEKDDSEVRLEYDADDLARRFCARLTKLLRASRDVAPVVAVATFSTKMRSSQSGEAFRRASESALFYMPFLSPDSAMRGYVAYNQAIRDAAAVVNPDPGVLLIEGEDSIPGDGQHFADSVHFTDAGCQRNAERITDALVRSGVIDEFDR